MRSVSLRSVGSVSLAAFVLVACGGAPPPPPPAPVKPAVPIATEPPVDTSPVPEPEGLLVVGRVQKPESILKTVGSWTHLPLPGGNELAKSVTDDAVGDALDLSLPIDGAVIVGGGMKDPQIWAAVSVAVRSLDDAKSKIGGKHKMVEGKNGSYWIPGIGKNQYDESPRGEDHDRDSDDEDGCALAPAAPSGARLVCGEREAVEQLTPYLTRTMPRKSWGADVHVEVTPHAVEKQAQQLRMLVPIFARGAIGGGSPALQQLVEASANELVDFVGDTERIAIDAQLGDDGTVATTKVAYSKANSLVAKLATSHPERADVPPAAFMHLPGDTDLALYTRGNDAKLFDHARELLGNVATEVTGDAGLPDAEKKALKDLVVDRMLPLFTGATVYGKGFDAAALDAAVAKRKNAKPNDWAAESDAERAVAEQIVGWHLVHVDEPIAKTGPVLKDWANLWNRPAFAKWAKSRASSKMLATMRVIGPPPGVALPKDTVHLEISFPQHDLVIPAEPVAAAPVPPLAPNRAPKGPTPASKPAPAKKIPQKPIVFHVIAVPDQGGTWLGFGLDPKILGQRAAAALSSAPDTSTLGKSATGEALETTKANGALLVTLRGLLVLTAMKSSRRSPWSALAAAPNQGKTPIVMTFASRGPSQDAAAGSAVSTFKLPRAAIEDVVKLVFASAR